MISIINIWNVARIETKTLLRSWFFRIFSGLAVVILIFFNLGILTDAGNSPWMFRAIPASIPYMNLLLLNVVQAAIAVFLASDFLKRDKKLDTTEVVYMRSMTNGDYVLGKSLGVLFVFLGLNAVVLLVALIYNVFFTDVPVNLTAYFLYPLLISLPTLVFVLGLSFLVMVIIQNQPVTFVVLLGYIALTLFFLSQKMHHLFDYMGFHVPFMYSDFVGFGDVQNLLLHRGMYFALGLAATFATVVFIKRLPQSNAMQVFSRVAAILLTVLGVGLAWLYLHNLSSGTALRSEMVALNNQYFDRPVASPIQYRLNVKHKDKLLEVKAAITVKNNTQKPIDTYIFQLNPGLEITDVQANGKALKFERKRHLLFISPNSALKPAAIDSFEIAYSGKPVEHSCFLDVDETVREQAFKMWMYVIKKRYLFLSPDYVLLTPEALWYPVPGVGFSSDHPEWHSANLADYKLTVETRPALLPISQGAMEKVSDGQFRFRPETALPGLSLVIGPYLTKSITVDSVDYSLYYLKDHDYFVPYLSAISDTLPSLIHNLKMDYEVDLELEYPYKRLQLIETPVQFYTYKRLWTESQESVQPEMVLLPEKAVFIESADFKRMQKWREKSRRWRNEEISDEEVQSGFFRRFVQSTFISGNVLGFMREGNQIQANPYYKIFPNYFSFVTTIQSRKWPVFQAAFESFLSNRVQEQGGPRFRFTEGLSTEEKIHIELQDRSLLEILADPEKKDIVLDVIKEKGKFLFSVLQSKIGVEAFNQFINDWLKRHNFRIIHIEELLNDLKQQFGVDMEMVLDQWMKSKQLPGFLISHVDAYEVVDQDRTRFQVRFKVTNVEPVEGVIHVSFRLGGGRGMFFMGMGGSPQSDVERLIYLSAHQTKEVGIVLDGQPRVMYINTFTSRNLPSSMTQFFEELELNEKATLFDGERITDEPVNPKLPNEIIVDNEDSGFKVDNPESSSLLKRWFRADEEESSEKYVGMRFWRPPTTWKATINSNFYGELVRSAYFTRSGDGNLKVSWTAQIPESGYYEIYTYLSRRGVPMRRRGRDRNQEQGEFHYIIHHDDGEEEVILDLKQMEDGWNFLGSYYISAGEAKVELTNQSKSRMVIADAIKWAKR